MPWNRLVHLGDLEVTMPAAAAIASWLLANRAWRLALSWTVMFVLGVSLVGASKIAYLGWGTGIDALQFKAISGHATGVTAVLPILLYLAAPRWRNAAVATGLGLGLAMALLLVRLHDHTLAEALAGWAMGAMISLGALRLAGDTPPPAEPFAFALAFLVGVWLMQWAHIGYWMIKLAMLLSGNRHPYSWG